MADAYVTASQAEDPPWPFLSSQRCLSSWLVPCPIKEKESRHWLLNALMLSTRGTVIGTITQRLPQPGETQQTPC